MFGFLRTRPDRIDTLIGPGIRVEGDLTFSGGLRIDGEVRGNVVAATEQPSVLVIGATGRVHGEVRATRMVVSGVVSGSIHASELLELHPGARISGDLRYGALEVHPGGSARGGAEARGSRTDVGDSAAGAGNRVSGCRDGGTEVDRAARARAGPGGERGLSVRSGR